MWGFTQIFDVIGKVVSSVYNVYTGYKQIEENIEQQLVPDAKETIEVVRAAMNDFVYTTTHLDEKIQTELIPDMKKTMEAARYTLVDINQTIKLFTAVSQQINRRISSSLDKVDDAMVCCKYGVEIGTLILMLFIAMLCRYELRKIVNHQGVFYRFEHLVLSVFRNICISFGIVRFILSLY